jgi:NADPH2:quinone reductase
MASFGNASGAVPPFALARLGAKNAKVLRPTLFNYIATREEFEQYTNELFEFIVKDKMDVRIHKVYDLENVATAHEVSRRHRAGGFCNVIMAVLTRI